MRKILGLLFSALVVFVSACAPAAPPRTAIPTVKFSVKTLTELAETINSSQCTYVAKAPIVNTNQPSLFEPVTSKDHSFGPENAYLTVVIYSDYQCPACAQFAALLKKIQGKHPKDIRIVHRNFPLLKINDKAAISTQAAEAAYLQGKFWEMHELLFAKQTEWVKLSLGEFHTWVTEQAAGLGLDTVKFKEALTSPAIVNIPQSDWQRNSKINLPGVPFILINGEIQKWRTTLLNDIETIINLDLLPTKQFDSCPPTVIDLKKQYIATLKTAKGDIVLKLFAEKAPNTVNNFVFLARQGWYDGLTFQRVIPGFIAQAGDPSATGQGHPGYFIPDEINKTLRYDRPGVLGMFNNGPNTNGSQFFITYTSVAKLNGKYTIFGEVSKGLEVLNNLTPRDALPGQSVPDGDTLISVTIEEK